MNKFFLLTLLMVSTLASQAQERHWVFFTDKGPQNLDQICPEDILSPEAIKKRQSRGTPLTIDDLPVWPDYLQNLRSSGLEVCGSSKWLNAAVVQIPHAQIEKIVSLPFVQEVRPVRVLKTARYEDLIEMEFPGTFKPVEGAGPLDYGQAKVQNHMLNIEALHDQGFTGNGVRIAVFDAGFLRANKLGVFDSLFRRDQILAAYDFVDNDPDVYGHDNHGTQVLSTIAANVPGVMIGMAPDATFLLARTEKSATETRQEEYNWVKAVEWADSIGVDVIHSSLGYSEFDDPNESYAFSEMDGGSTIVTQAADMAAARGILVVTSAGNEGSGSWRKITAPCDADSALCVGSVDSRQRLSRFSSVGPTADGRLKPDVVAQGSRTTVANPNGNLGYSYGTSYSAPLVAGLVTCLRQAHPGRSNMDIIRAVRLSSNRLANPDTMIGYGVPNAGRADSLLKSGSNLELMEKEFMVKFPNLIAGGMIYENEDLVVRKKGNTLILMLSDGSDAIKKVLIKGQGGKMKLKVGGAGSSPSKWIINSESLRSGEYKLKLKSGALKENLIIVLP